MKRGGKSTKAQAAIETIIMYGITVVIIIIMAAVFSFMGVLHPEKWIPDYCAIAVGIHCPVFFSDTSVVTLAIQNQRGETFYNSKVEVNIKGVNLAPAGLDCVNGAGVTVRTGESVICTYHSQTAPLFVSEGDKLKARITLQWSTKGGFIRTRTGTGIMTVNA